MNSRNWQTPDDSTDDLTHDPLDDAPSRSTTLSPDTSDDDAIINPVKGRSSKALGSTLAMICNPDDLNWLCTLTSIDGDSCARLYNSKLYISEPGTGGFSIVGPFIGAPYAVFLLETLIARGARKIVFLGLCGAVSRDVSIGDLIVPDKSLIDEGTSPAYLKGDVDGSRPSRNLSDRIKAELKTGNIPFHEGAVWSTDAIYRETRKKVAFYQREGVLGVEMETSALFTVGRYRGVQVAALLVVSDELSTFRWRHGFKDPRLKQQRKVACEVIGRLCQIL